jgi:hypothetical protein
MEAARNSFSWGAANFRRGRQFSKGEARKFAYKLIFDPFKEILSALQILIIFIANIS